MYHLHNCHLESHLSRWLSFLYTKLKRKTATYRGGSYEGEDPRAVLEIERLASLVQAETEMPFSLD